MFYSDVDLYSNEIYLTISQTIEYGLSVNDVPSYRFDICILETSQKVGECSLRIGYNENMYYRGNIGYEIIEEYRGKNYAGKACALLIKQAKKHNMPYIIITCDEDNIASYKSCIYAGGSFIETTDVPKHTESYEKGARRKNIFKFTL